MTDLLVPLLLLLGCGAVFRGVDVYGAFLRGAERGLRTLFAMAKALVPLLAILGMLLSSGFPEWLFSVLSPLCNALGLDPAVLPVILLRPLSGSAALSAASELVKREGASALSSRIALAVLASGETTVYVAGLYLAGRRTRYAPAVLISALAGDLAAAFGAVFLILHFFQNSP